MKREKAKKKKGEIQKEEVSEIFEVEKEGKEKVIETHAVEETDEKPVSEMQVKKENKVLKNIVITMAGFVLMFLVVYFIITSMTNFEVDGVKFKTVKEGEIILYQTSIPVLVENKTKASYNFYLRTDPKVLKKEVPLEGDVIFRKNLVLDVTTKNLFCGGDWTIALVNLNNLYTLLGFNVSVKNESKTYTPENKYMFVTINEGNKTEIREITGDHYDVNVTNCEVLPAFERLMLETFIRYKEAN